MTDTPDNTRTNASAGGDAVESVDSDAPRSAVDDGSVDPDTRADGVAHHGGGDSNDADHPWPAHGETGLQPTGPATNHTHGNDSFR